MQLSLPMMIALALIGCLLVMKLLQPTPDDLMRQQYEANQQLIEQQSQQMLQSIEQTTQMFQNSQAGPQVYPGYAPNTGYPAQHYPQGSPQNFMRSSQQEAEQSTVNDADVAFERAAPIDDTTVNH